MRLTFHVKQRGRLCIITGDDGRIRHEVPRTVLRRQMEPYGIAGNHFQELCDALDLHGEATIEGLEILGRFSQRLPSL